MQDQKYTFTKLRDFPIVQGKIVLQPAKSHLPLPLHEYHKFLICSDFTPYGFLTAARKYGMGVPLIALPDEDYDLTKANKIDKKIYGIYNAPMPATVFLRIKDQKKGVYNGCLEFYDPYKHSELMINNQKAPLEVDITTPLGYLTRKGPSYSGFSALANPKNMHISEGLYFFTPYDKDKIPLVIVHGLMSEPGTWVQMLNTLMNNKAIREKYQIWFFAYPTGFPILLSSAKLRSSLLKARQILDPENDDPNFEKTVIIGHSMGGLLTRTMVQSSGDAVEKMVFEKPVKELDVKPETKEILSNALVFEPVPYINRVIFMSTPHRGAEMTHWPIMRLAVKFINLPGHLLDVMDDVADNVTMRKGVVVGGKPLRNIQGVDGLDPKNKVMRHLANVPLKVKYHTISGNIEKAGEIGGGDGIVTYRSSHLDGAESELVIKSGHNTQKMPAGIKEVRRILLLHLDEANKK